MNFDCRRCTNWRGCPGKEWYSFGEIRWCAQQVFFLLKFAEILRQGIWPTPETTIAGIKAQMTREATFTKAATIIAELDVRLQTTNWRGRLLCEECINREKLDYLSHDAKQALYYVSGWRRKAMPFLAWRKQRQHRRKTDNQRVIKNAEIVSQSA